MEPDDRVGRPPPEERLLHLPLHVPLSAGSGSRQRGRAAVEFEPRALAPAMAEQLPQEWKIECNVPGNVHARARPRSRNACRPSSMARGARPRHCCQANRETEPALTRHLELHARHAGIGRTAR